jgi:hypothetical protein
MPIKLTALTQASIIGATDLLYAAVGGNSRRIPALALAGRNRIINGQGRINQRGYVSGTATVGANEYTLDRWRVVTSGQNLTFTGTDAARTMTAPAGGCEQVIEGANIEGGTYVINWTGTATCTVDGTPRAKGATFTLTANTNATVRFTSGTFTDVQVELGTTATPFERLPFGDELARCQRYFLNLPLAGVFAICRAINFSASTTPVTGGVQFPVTMRAAPVATYTWEISDVLQGGAMTTFNTNTSSLIFVHSIAAGAIIDLNATTLNAEL